MFKEPWNKGVYNLTKVFINCLTPVLPLEAKKKVSCYLTANYSRSMVQNLRIKDLMQHVQATPLTSQRNKSEKSTKLEHVPL